MNLEEQRLADWLHDITPEPPRTVSLEDIAARVGHEPPPRRPRSWLPLLAAACVVALVAALALALRDTGSTRPAHPTPSRKPTTAPTGVQTSSSPPTRRTSPPPPTLAARPWGATRVAGLDLRPNSMVGYRGRLYALDRSGKLLDIAPASGRVVASAAPVAGTTQIDDFVVSSGSVWTVGVAGSSVRIEKYDATTLRPQAGTQLGGAHRNAGRYGTLLAADPGRPWIFVGGGRTVHLLDGNLGPLRTFTVPGGQISDIAASPDGTILYVASGPELGQRIYVLDVRSGRQLGTVDLGPGMAGGLVGLRPTAGGLFLTSAEGHVASVLFVSFPPGGSAAPATEGSGGGGFLPQATLSGGVAWIGGTRLGCANPSDGRLRATTDVDPGKADVSSMTVIDRHVYAVYQGGEHAVVELHPPAACRVR